MHVTSFFKLQLESRSPPTLVSISIIIRIQQNVNPNNCAAVLVSMEGAPASDPQWEDRCARLETLARTAVTLTQSDQVRAEGLFLMGRASHARGQVREKIGNFVIRFFLLVFCDSLCFQLRCSFLLVFTCEPSMHILCKNCLYLPPPPLILHCSSSAPWTCTAAPWCSRPPRGGPPPGSPPAGWPWRSCSWRRTRYAPGFFFFFPFSKEKTACFWW